ncbi:MAG: FecR domain-containing protein [Candidatus Spyradosoma sp.]
MKFAKLVSIVLSPIFLAAALFAAPEATVQAAKNDVVVVVNGVATALKPGDTVPAGAVVKAGKGSAAQLKLPDGSLIGVGEGAEVVVSVSETGTATVIGLSSGTITVQAPGAAKSSVTIQTPSGTVSGTKGTVTVTATAATVSVTSTSGNWRVTSTNGDTGVLGTNQTVMVKKDDSTFAPRPATATETAKAETTLSADGAPGAEKPSAPVAPAADSGASSTIEGNDVNTNVTPNSPAVQ